MGKMIRIGLKKERALLSDVLPYETPITFSNRFFYDFIAENQVSVSRDTVQWKSGGVVVDEILSLIFGFDRNELSKIPKGINGFKECKDKNIFITIPFNYGISHKENSFRLLSVMHPRNQVQVVGFYEKYKEIILYFSQLSDFTLRSPSRVASTQYYNDENKSGSVILSKSLDKNSDQKYKNLKSFFGYRKISNIHQFFESNEYHSCEKKYNKLAQLDISKCFDSVYTHSISWATLGRDVVKNNLASGKKGLDSSFADDFDRLMQKQNYNETNGILIGPELSRVFAEIILQKVDLNLKSKLDLLGVKHNSDYDIFRYVDDFFIFYNDDLVYRNLVSELESCLGYFKFGLNSEKETIYQKPIITEITIAKKKISSFLSEKVKMEVIEPDDCGSGNECSAKIHINSKSLITQYKIILAESGADYKSVINYTFAIVEKSVKKIFKKYVAVDKKSSVYRSLLESINAIIDFCFFIYSVAPRVNTTIKLSRVLKVIIDFSRTKNVYPDDMHQIFKQIYDNVFFVIKKYGTNEHTQVETLYLLTLMTELGKDYWIEESVLVRYFGGVYNSENVVLFERSLNYFSITVLLFYIKNKKRYSSIRDALKVMIKFKFEVNCELLSKDTECLLLLLDCISCPYLDVEFKKNLLVLNNIHNLGVQEEIISYRDNWFTKWVDFEFGRELDAKQSGDVY